MALCQVKRRSWTVAFEALSGLKLFWALDLWRLGFAAHPGHGGLNSSAFHDVLAP
jgi:hypothetical protein